MTYPLPEAGDSILKLRSFGAAFGDKIILNDLYLDVYDKAITVLLGPAGTGKSTLLRSIAGLNVSNPSFRAWGYVSFLDEQLNENNRPSLVTQSAKLMVRSVLENIIHNLPERHSLSQSQQKDLAVRLLEQAGLEQLKDSLNENVVSLSLAMQRRIAILRLSSAGPRLLCLDEPTVGMNDMDIAGMLEHIRAESQRRAIMLILHNQQQARALGGYSALLAGGQILEFKPTEDFFSNPQDEAAQQFVKSGSCSVASPSARPDELDESVEVPAEVPNIAQQYISESFGPRGFLWLLKGQLAGTPLPGVFFNLQYDLKALQRVGITRLISTTQNPVPVDALEQYGIAGKHFPIKDMGIPSLDEAVDICRYIEKMLGEEQVIAVHCRAGLGRTGTVLAMYLVWQGHDALSALEKVRNIEPRWVQSTEQIEFLDKFHQHIVDCSSSIDSDTRSLRHETSNAI